MSQDQYFDGFSEEKQKQYERQIRERYGEAAFKGAIDWNHYTPEQKARIKAEGEAVYHDLVDLIEQDPASPAVQAAVARWRQHLRYFYEPSTERLLGLADLYNEDPQFQATFHEIHPGLADFMRKAVRVYCQNSNEGES